MTNSNMANNPDGSFHIYLEPKKKPKPILKEIKVEKKEVKLNDKKDRE